MEMSENEPAAGTLYVVATPIGNLEDITLRALRVLGGVDWIAAEDTRRTRKLLSHYKISVRLISFHGDAGPEKASYLAGLLESGQSGAVVSDAGTPGASDPGGRLVAAAAARGIRVVPIPGASAIAAALSAAGVESPRFIFEGFLPRSGAKREKIIESFACGERHVMFFESANRVAATLRELHGKLGDRRVILFRELTKVHEEIVRTTLGRAAADEINIKEIGEYTILVQGREEPSGVAAVGDAGLDRAVVVLASAGLTSKDISRVAAELLGVSKNRAYEAAMALMKKTK
jgi:16S rRNA (cytidine1402-2'-O)-methyltransferase